MIVVAITTKTPSARREIIRMLSDQISIRVRLTAFTKYHLAQKGLIQYHLFRSKFISNILSNKCLIISQTDLPTLPSDILNQYLVHHTIWNFHFHTVFANLLTPFIKYNLLKFREAGPHIKVVFLLVKSLSNPQSKDWVIA